MWVCPQLVFGGSPPSPIAIGGQFPQAKALPPPPSPSHFPPHPPWFVLQWFGSPAGGGPVWRGGRGPRGGGGGGPSSGTGSQTHIWGYSSFLLGDVWGRFWLLFFVWVHAYGGIANGGVACVGAKWRSFVHSCAFLRVFVHFCAFFSHKMGCKKAHICAELCKNVQQAFLCNTPFSYTPFCVPPICIELRSWEPPCLPHSVLRRCQPLVAFQTHSQNRSALAPQLPKSQPCPRRTRW